MRIEHLQAMLAEEDVEDGLNHPAETCLSEILSQGGEEELVDCVLSENLSPGMAGSILRLMGRARPPSLVLRRRLYARCLASKSVEIRDAIVGAMELWEDREALGFLENHEEQVRWLADSIAQVIEDMGVDFGLGTGAQDQSG